MSAVGLDPALQVICRAALSLLFGSAALHKLRDVQGFRQALEAYDLVPRPWAVPAGAGVVAAEVGIAAGLWLPRVAPMAALTGAALLIVYATAIGVNLVRGRRDIDCGCGGPAGGQPISGRLVVRNALLVAVAVTSALPAGSRPLLWFDAVTVVAAVATTALLYAAADQLGSHHRGPQRNAEAAPN